MHIVASWGLCTVLSLYCIALMHCIILTCSYIPYGLQGNIIRSYKMSAHWWVFCRYNFNRIAQGEPDAINLSVEAKAFYPLRQLSESVCSNQKAYRMVEQHLKYPPRTSFWCQNWTGQRPTFFVTFQNQNSDFHAHWPGVLRWAIKQGLNFSFELSWVLTDRL